MKSSKLLLLAALISSSGLAYASINVNQPIESLVTYVKGLVFTDNWLPDGEIKAILSANPARDISFEVSGESYVENQLLIGDYCKDNYLDNGSFKLCIAWWFSVGDLIFKGESIQNNTQLNIKIWRSLNIKSDQLPPLMVVDKANRSVVIDPTGLTVMSNGVYVAWPAYINGSSTVWCSAATLWAIKKVGSDWQVCEPARDKNWNPTGWYAFKTIIRWDGTWLPIALPTTQVPSSTTTPAPIPWGTVIPLPTDPTLPSDGGSAIPLPTDPTIPETSTSPSAGTIPSSPTLPPINTSPSTQPVIFY